MTGRRRSLAGLWLRMGCFAVLAALTLGYATYVLTPKYDYGICAMTNLYDQPEGSIDVLVVGTSMCYAGVNTNVLWTEYGIAAYDLCSAEQPFWVSYYALKEAFKTQRPRVVLLDAQPARYQEDYSKPARVVLSTYGMRGIENRIGAIRACVATPGEAADFLLGLPQVHGNYRQLTRVDFAYPPDNGQRGSSWKGYIELDEVEKHVRPSLVWDDACAPLNPRQEEYVRRIFALCQAEGVEIMLLGVPIPDYDSDHLYYNALWKIAAEYGVGGLNYNDPTLRFGLKYASDFADWQHLNVHGSVVFTRRLGEDLRALFDLPDHRGDAAYTSYDICADNWYTKYPDFISGGESQ